MDNVILDGPLEDQVIRAKSFLGLSPEQSFQDLETDESDEDI